MLRNTFTLLFAVCTVVCPCGATGPSFAEASIIPLAANDYGVVIFKTILQINKMGAYSYVGTQYGWLCASSSGLWKEQLYFTVTDEDADIPVQSRKLAKFSERTDLKDPPPSLQALMDTCGVMSWKALNPNEGRGRVLWQPSRLCVDGNCVERVVPQRSLGGLTNTAGVGNSVESRFFYFGLAVFDNREHFAEPAQIGAQFHVENLINGEDAGMDIMAIAAIAVLDPSSRDK